MKKHLIWLMPLLLLGGCGDPPAQIMHVSKGQATFLESCVSCHPGPGNPPGPNDVVLQSAMLADEEGFIRFLRKPISPSMPPVDENTLSAEDAHWLYEYLKDQAQKASKP